jgi:predicted transcriptional regulator
LEYKQETKRLDVFRRELADMAKAKQAKLEVIGQVDSTISTLRHKIDSFSRERKSAHDAIERIENTYEWVSGAKKCALPSSVLSLHSLCACLLLM